MRQTSVSVRLTIPFFGDIRGTWEPDDAERKAAWELYVEMVTRIGVVELRPGEGSLREALASMYSLFDTTRAILRANGPQIAAVKRRPFLKFFRRRRQRPTSDLSLGTLALAVLNGAVRPVLARWHPLLADHEARRPEGITPLEHERSWGEASKLRDELNSLRHVLLEATHLLSVASGATDVVPLAINEATNLLTSPQRVGPQ